MTRVLICGGAGFENSRMSEERFDVIYDEHGCRLEHHFCREWDGEVGCYGTNPNHGFSFEEARETVAAFYATEAERWRALTYEDWAGKPAPQQEGD